MGEKYVREIIPDATIVRPGMMWGHEDRFLNKIGGKEIFFSFLSDDKFFKVSFYILQLMKDGNIMSMKVKPRFALFL